MRDQKADEIPFLIMLVVLLVSVLFFLAVAILLHHCLSACTMERRRDQAKKRKLKKYKTQLYALLDKYPCEDRLTMLADTREERSLLMHVLEQAGMERVGFVPRNMANPQAGARGVRFSPPKEP